MITTGTDTLEELAVLCALLYAGHAPIVLTGANRPASRPGADGPANLLDAVALAAAAEAAGLGVSVVFGGEIHAAMSVHKVDSTGPAAASGSTPGRCARTRLTHGPSSIGFRSSLPRWATTGTCSKRRRTARTV